MKLLISELLKSDESKTLEFKQDLSSIAPIIKTLTAFANSAGGRLVLGVTSGRDIIGFEDPLLEEERLCNIIADSIAPRLVPNIELVTAEGKTLLIAEVFLSSSRPHFIRSEGIDNGVYVRLGSTNRRADSQLIAELQRGASGISFDTLPMPDSDRETLNYKAIEADFKGKRNTDDQMLQSLRILVKDQGRLVPSHAGYLLYANDRLFHFPDAWIQCGRFFGNDKSNIFDQHEIHEPLPASVGQIMLFLKKHAIRAADFSEIRRKDIWSIPVEILREAVINAIVHSDYSHRGNPIRIAFFDNRIEIENPGHLLPGMTIEDMKQGVSQVRNPVIARVFRELNFMEQWGSGFPGILKRAAAEGLKEPFIEELIGRVRLTIYLKKSILLKESQFRHPPEDYYQTEIVKETTHKIQSTGPVRRPSQGPSEPDRNQQILNELAESPMSAGELAIRLGIESKSGAFKRAIKDLLDKGLIEYTIPEKPASRLQKYRIKGNRREH